MTSLTPPPQQISKVLFYTLAIKWARLNNKVSKDTAVPYFRRIMYRLWDAENELVYIKELLEQAELIEGYGGTLTREKARKAGDEILAAARILEAPQPHHLK